MALSYNQQKALLGNISFYRLIAGRRHYGKLIGFAEDHRGFGGVVRHQDGGREFWVINPFTMQAEAKGIPPQPRRRF